jgi:hypothetical protein
MRNPSSSEKQNSVRKNSKVHAASLYCCLDKINWEKVVNLKLTCCTMFSMWVCCAIPSLPAWCY